MTTTWDHVLRTALINLHAFEFGYTVAFTGATLQSMIDAVDLCGGADLCAEASFVASAAPLGALLAAAVAGRLLDSYGRRTFLIAVSALWVVGYVVVACASSLVGFALGRAVAGAAMGATSVAVPVYSCVKITLDGVGEIPVDLHPGLRRGARAAEAARPPRRPLQRLHLRGYFGGVCVGRAPVQNSSCRDASPPRLNHDLHVIDGTPAR